MRARIKQKWRPSLALVIGGTLAAVLAAPTFGLLMLRALADDIGLRQSVVLIGAGVVLVTVILGYLLWRLILGPVRRLATQSEAFAAGQSTPYNPQSHYGTRELQELGQSVLDMAEGLFSRQETVRTYTNHVTHELKSPLTALIGAVELLEAGGLTSDQHARMLTTVRQSADRMQALLEGMRQIAVAREPLGQGKCTLDTVLAQIAADYALRFKVEGGGLPLPLPKEGLEVILRQMLGNAVAHGADTVQLTVGGEVPVLTISDNGMGISDGNRAHLFAPFFTTRRDVGGTGMGLTIVRSLLEVRGGGIEVHDSDQGATFEVRL